MSGEPVLLDSVVLIDHFNGHGVASDYLRDVDGRAFVSAIARAEVLAGFDDPDAEIARQLLDRLPLIPIDRDVADVAARLRREVMSRQVV